MKRIIPFILTVLLLSGACGGEGETDETASRSKDHNQADVSFAQMMIPHHEQAIEMSQMAVKQASAQQVKDLAGRIEQAQGPEIQTMRRLLSDWGESAAAGGMHEQGMGQGMSGMGMMSEAQMQELAKASGKSFDRMFLQMMIEHHEGAIGMAEQELSSGMSGEAKDLAREIRSSQQKEVEEMRTLLEELR